jgi:hypothetical protein
MLKQPEMMVSFSAFDDTTNAVSSSNKVAVFLG